MTDLLKKYAVEYRFSLAGENYRITRYDNHWNLLDDHKWAVVWKTEYYLHRRDDELEIAYKRFIGFNSAEEAYETLSQYVQEELWRLSVLKHEEAGT